MKDGIIGVVFIVLWQALIVWLVYITVAGGMMWLSFVILIVNFFIIGYYGIKVGEHNTWKAFDQMTDEAVEKVVRDKMTPPTGLN